MITSGSRAAAEAKAHARGLTLPPVPVDRQAVPDVHVPVIAVSASVAAAVAKAASKAVKAVVKAVAPKKGKGK